MDSNDELDGVGDDLFDSDCVAFIFDSTTLVVEFDSEISSFDRVGEDRELSVFVVSDSETVSEALLGGLFSGLVRVMVTLVNFASSCSFLPLTGVVTLTYNIVYFDVAQVMWLNIIN